MDQEQIDEILPNEAQVRAARDYIESCQYSSTALMAFVAALWRLGQADEAGILQTVVEEFAETEIKGAG